MKNNRKNAQSEMIGCLMGQFFAKLTENHRRAAAARIDSIVGSALVLLDQMSSEDVSPEFADYLRYIIKKSGEQKKTDLRLQAKRSRTAQVNIAA